MTDLTDFKLIEEPKYLDFKANHKRRRLTGYLKKHDDNVTIFDIYEKIKKNEKTSHYLFLHEFELDDMNTVASVWRKLTLKDIEKRIISSLHHSMEANVFCPVEYDDIFAKFESRFSGSPKGEQLKSAAFDKNTQLFNLDSDIYKMCKKLVKNLDQFNSNDRRYGVALLNDIIGKWRVRIEKTRNVSKLKGYDPLIVQKYASNGTTTDANRTISLKAYVDRNFDSENRVFKSDKKPLGSLVGARSASIKTLEKIKK